VLEQITSYGSYGVHLFFIISGFVIALSSEGRTAAKFLRARALRLYPAFIASCTITVFVLALSGFSIPVWRYLANITLFAPYLGQASIDSVYWSLYIEVRFYLFIALIIAIGQQSRIMWFMAAWILLSVTNLWVTIPRGIGTLAYAPLFISGVIYSLVSRKTVRNWHYALLVLCIALSVVYAEIEIAQPAVILKRAPIAVGLLICSFHALMFAIARGKLRVSTSATVGLLGALSYPIYLLHEEIGNALLRSIRMPPYLALFAVCMIIIFAAWLVCSFVETPFRTWANWNKNKLPALT